MEHSVPLSFACRETRSECRSVGFDYDGRHFRTRKNPPRLLEAVAAGRKGYHLHMQYNVSTALNAPLRPRPQPNWANMKAYLMRRHMRDGDRDRLSTLQRLLLCELAWCAGDPRELPTARRIYLASEAGIEYLDPWTVRVTYAELRKATGASRPTLARALGGLVDLGLIRRERRAVGGRQRHGGVANLYHLDFLEQLEKVEDLWQRSQSA